MYVSGMSNIASPLFYVQDSEGAAYVCFCALMQRTGRKFCPQNQLLMIIQMQHLHDLLVFIDYELAQFLRLHHLGNMFFTERWLLLELVREFAFEHALYVSEVQWAALSVTANWNDSSASPVGTSLSSAYLLLSELTSPVTFDSVDKSGSCYSECDIKLINSLVGEEYAYTPIRNISTDSVMTPPTFKQSDSDESLREGDPIHMKDWVVELPPPDQLGGGHPFLLFICISMLLEHKEKILEEVHEASDLFHLFQKENKRHNPVTILNRARTLFDQYLKDQEIKRRDLAEFPPIDLYT